ncbi:tyrosine-type recombinase/integrase [Thiocystis violacea]|uniref:tyrosine-type recombinase/integrase n=1 Tax=Thiocystis violacea TaxID=13725 RepID=UPI001907B0D4|nr:site-specific integrase [Thiocystis violacea]
MRLFFATADFRLLGISYPGFPLLLNEDMELELYPFRYLVHECLHRGRVSSQKSWAAYGQALYDYFGFLEARNLDWRQCQANTDHSILAAYREWSVGLGLKHTTVNQRVRVVVRFYQYAAREEWIQDLPFELESVVVRRPKDFLSHTDRTGGQRMSADVMLPAKRPTLKVLSIGEIRQLLEGTSNATLNLLYRMAVQTGLRKEELLTFPVTLVTNPAHNPSHRSMIRVHLDPAKMALKDSKPRAIDIPRRLMERLWEYRLHERHHRLLQNGIGTGPETLFVTERGAPFSARSSAIMKHMKQVLGHGSLHTLRHNPGCRIMPSHPASTVWRLGCGATRLGIIRGSSGRRARRRPVDTGHGPHSVVSFDRGPAA